MPFPVDEKYILETEKLLNFEFPLDYKESMKLMNGGSVKIRGEIYWLFPIFDKSDKKRISRTCNSVHRETATARDYFLPKEAVAIASDGGGNCLVFFPNDPSVYFFHHELHKAKKVANTFSELARNQW